MSESFDPMQESWETYVERTFTTPSESLKSLNLFDISSPHPLESEETTEKRRALAEYTEKRQALAESLLFIATGYSWEDAEGVDHFHHNYTADADDVLRQHPHLLGLTTREMLGLDDPEALPGYAEQDATMVQGFFEHLQAQDDEMAEVEPEDEVLEVKPSNLPVDTLIDDQEHGPFLKDSEGMWFEVVDFRHGMLVYDEGPTTQDVAIFSGQRKVVDTPADEFFKDFTILAAPLGWEPPRTTYHTLEYFNHETGKMERKALASHIPERKEVDD